MGNQLTGASRNKIQHIANASITQGFFSEFVIEWSIARLTLCRERYKDSFMLTPLKIDDLKYVVSSINDSKIKLLFDLFSQGTSGHSSCDGLALLGGLCMDCRAVLSDRLKFAFCLYDFDGNRTLNLAELTMMVRTTLGGMATLGGVPCPEIEDLHRVAKQIFTAADTNHDGKLTLDEFIDWSTKSKDAIQFFQTHQNTLNAEIAQMKSDPNDKGSVKLSAFEDAEAQLLDVSSDTLDLRQHYLGDMGLSDLIDDLRYVVPWLFFEMICFYSEYPSKYIYD